MLTYLEKFNKLPGAVRSQVSDARALAIIEALEKKYKVALAVLIMKTIVGEIALNNLAESLLKENMPKVQADELAKELKEKLFFSMGNYFVAGAVKLAAPVGQAKVKGAGFFFSADDEEEIRQLTKRIAAPLNSAPASGAIDDQLKEIISRTQINFSSADLVDRFSRILRTYLRGIRNKLDIKATLMKPFLNGGLSFDEASAEKVMLLADKVLNRVKLLRADKVGFNGVNLNPGLPASAGQPIKPLLKTRLLELEKSDFSPKREISRDAAYDFSKLAVKKLDTIHELAPLTPAGIPVAIAPKDALKPQATKALVAPIRPAIESDQAARPLIKRRFKAENSSQDQKVKIEDVKYVPKVMGPLDELKYLDLINFRRLDPNPLKSADKIKSKINLLAEENYGKKLEGIKLWRLSPINKLYLAIGHLSISENKPVDAIIEDRKLNNQEYLTAEEFKAIMDLNKSLRF